MPLNVPITEEMVRGLAPDNATWEKAQEIARGDKFVDPGVSADGTWLLAEAKGSGKESYHLSADFADPNHPVLRSTGPGSRTPDKYSLALLLSYAQKPDSFGSREPSDELVVRREKRLAAEDRKKFGPAAPKRTSKVSLDKKAMAQLEGIEHLDKLLFELVEHGKWFETNHLEKLERTAKSLSDASLPLATHTLRRLILIGKQKGIGEDDRTLLAADVLGQLWASVQASKAAIADPEGSDQALLEELLGRHSSAATTKNDVSLFEIAYERGDDDSRQQRVEISDLIDLESGEIVQAIAYRPYKGVTPVPEQSSYTGVVRISEATIQPGFVNKRIWWDKTAETIGRSGGDILEKVYALAQTDFTKAIEAFHEQLKNPLAPREAVFLLKADQVGKIGDRVTVIADEADNRIEMADRRKDYSNAANLIRAASMLGKDKPAVLVRLFVHPTTFALQGTPLAALTPKHHLRLGL
jgi:hypothetical protein